MASTVPTTDQLRDAIDSGKTGEKVAHLDPAAAPLGTDAEAGGNTPTLVERKMESLAQVEQPVSVPPNGIAIYLGLIALVAVAIFLILSFAR
jgi:hypothetical protein